MFGKKRKPSSHQQPGLQHWEKEVNAICAAQKLGKVTVVIELDPKKSLNAKISGSTMTIGQGLVGCAKEHRLYIIAHELGHRQHRHEKWLWLTLVSAIAGFVLGSNLHSPVLIFTLVLFPFLLYHVIREKTLVIEWQADAAGACMLDEYEPGKGLKLMGIGMRMQEAQLIAKFPDDRDFYRHYYDSKMAKLNGRHAAWWVR